MKKVMATTALALFGLMLISANVLAGQGGGTGPVINGNAPSTQLLRYYAAPGQCQDIFVSGVKLRNAPPAPPGASGSIQVPANVAANAVFAELYWVVLDDVVPPATESFNGTPLVRDACAPVTGDPCWPTAFAYAWHADVLGLLTPGANVLSGFPDNGVLGGAPNSEGATLVVVYTNPGIDKEIFVYCGNDILDPSVGASAVDLAIAAGVSPAGIGADLYFIGGDGQSVFDDDVYWNGIPLGGGNAWQGLDQGPGTTAGGGGYWDSMRFGVANNPPRVASSASLAPSFDCINWVATVYGTKYGGCVTPALPKSWGTLKTRYR